MQRKESSLLIIIDFFIEWMTYIVRFSLVVIVTTVLFSFEILCHEDFLWEILCDVYVWLIQTYWDQWQTDFFQVIYCCLSQKKTNNLESNSFLFPRSFQDGIGTNFSLQALENQLSRDKSVLWPLMSLMSSATAAIFSYNSSFLILDNLNSLFL